MTLDEAIKHAEETAERCRSDAHVCEDMAVFERSINHNTEAKICEQEHQRCYECAEEHRQLAEWLRELKQLRNQTRWIPVSERLPNRNTVYIVTRIIDGTRITDASYFDGQNTWHRDTGVNHGRPYLTDIIAWMPKPEPYKEQKQKKEEPITLTDEQITEMWESGYISDKEEEDV